MTADELEALAAKATQGPWFVSGVRFRTNGRDWPSINRYDESKKQDENIACVGFDPRNGKGLTDAKLIVALVNNAPRLIEALHASELYEDTLRDLVRGAYIDGATDTHNSWVRGDNSSFPDFGEAGDDYARSTILPAPPATEAGE